MIYIDRPGPRRLATFFALVVAVTTTIAAAAPPELEVSRTDQRPNGNRIASGSGRVGNVVDVALGAKPAWVLAQPAAAGAGWLVALADGSVVSVSVGPDGVPSVAADIVATLRPGEPIVVTPGEDGEQQVGSALDAANWFEDPIPGARTVHAVDGSAVALTGPTRRYPHGVLGDDVEASAVSVRMSDGGTTRIEVGEAQVIEGLSPMLADLTGDGVEEVIVTVSDLEVGARLVVYGLDGERIASSQPIGRAFRWLHQIGVGSLGPAGETEIVVVRTPHIGGIVEAYRLVDDRLELVASEPGYSSHRLGSPNLDMSLLADLDGDGRLDVVVPTQDMTSLGVLARTDSTFELIDTLPLGGTLVTNVAAIADADGRLVLAAGTDDGRLRIFR